jgi:arylsulfatase A-like enzyme
MGKKAPLKLKPDFSWVGEASESPRSIVLLSLDTVRADRLGVYGGRAEVPALSAFGGEGVRFEYAISHFPETALSHWSMMTGVLPEVHGNVPGNGGSLYRGPTLAEIAKEHGYATAAFIGGVTLTDEASGLARGFDVYDDSFTFSQEDMSRDGAEVTGKAMDWIKKQDGPYFLFVHYFDAHFPYTPAAPYDKKYDPAYAGSLDGSDASLRPYRDGGKQPSEQDLAHVLALYDGELSELDGKIEPLLGALGSDIVVAVTSDHGESFEHGYYFNHRAGLWDGVVRVPLLIRGPGVPAGSVVMDQVGLSDLLPTLLGLSGLPSDKRIQGSSLLPLLEGGVGGSSMVYSITDPWMPDPQFSVRTVSRKWISGEKSELVYDLSTDPGEESPSGGVPSFLSDSKQAYRSQVESLSSHQAEAPKPRFLSPEECSRLEALGYTTCQGPAQGHPPP